jgi:hypothetical protein
VRSEADSQSLWLLRTSPSTCDGTWDRAALVEAYPCLEGDTITIGVASGERFRQGTLKVTSFERRLNESMTGGSLKACGVKPRHKKRAAS